MYVANHGGEALQRLQESTWWFGNSSNPDTPTAAAVASANSPSASDPAGQLADSRSTKSADVGGVDSPASDVSMQDADEGSAQSAGEPNDAEDKSGAAQGHAQASPRTQGAKATGSKEANNGANNPPLDITVVLMDQEMPVMDGMQCTRTIREWEGMGKLVGHVPIIAVTANARREQIAALKAVGMVSFTFFSFLFSPKKSGII